MLCIKGGTQIGKKTRSCKSKINTEFAWSSLTEISADFTVPLKDASVKEKSTAEFYCELTLPVDKVRWFLDDVELRPNEKITMIDDGKVHKLVIKDVDVTDEGQVSVLVGDKKSTAALFVQELSPDFVKPLSNIVIKERETAEFVTEVNKEGITVKWFIDNKEIEEDEKYEIYSEGRTHRLVVKDAVLPDSGEIIARVEGKMQKATLTIEGMTALLCVMNSHELGRWDCVTLCYEYS